MDAEVKKGLELILSSMTEEDKKEAAVMVLAGIDPKKPFGTELFNAIFKVSIGVAMETVALRINPETGQMEVFLAWRDNTAPAYKNTWHCPGTFFRPGEEEKETLKRLEKNEYGCQVQILSRAGSDNNPKEERGHCVHLVYLVKILGESTRGKWFPLNTLPGETVEHHRRVVIPMAIEAFK